MTPRIVKSDLTQRWYIATRYQEKHGINTSTGEPTRYLVASRKYDVTDQMEAILAEETRRRRRRRNRQRPARRKRSAVKLKRGATGKTNDKS